MLHKLAIVLLPAALVLSVPATADAQFPRPVMAADGVAGPYVNTDTGMVCQVYRMGRGYVFVDEAGTRVPFIPVSANRLRSANMGVGRIPEIEVTVGQDNGLRTILRFDARGVTPGFWVSAQ